MNFRNKTGKRILAILLAAVLVAAAGNAGGYSAFATEMAASEAVMGTVEEIAEEMPDETAGEPDAEADELNLEAETETAEPEEVDADAVTEVSEPGEADDDADEEEINLLAATDVPEADGDVTLTEASVQIGFDGTEPFDRDDMDGNDSSANNGIVRSFDEVEYAFSVSTDLGGYTGSTLRVWVEMTLTGSTIENEFAADLINLDHYDIVEDTTSRTLTGYIDFAISGGQNTLTNMTIGVQVLAMDDGTVLQPTGKVWLEEEDENGTFPDSGGVTSEAKDFSFPDLTVSARLQLNVYLAQNTTSSRAEGTYAFNDSATDYPNYGKGNVEGRFYGYALVLQMYDTGGKGMKGQALPSGEDVEIAITISSSYVANGVTYNLDSDFDGNYQELFYSAEEMTTTQPVKKTGRSIQSLEGYMPSWAVTYNAPYNKATSSQLGKSGCENGGSWDVLNQNVTSSGTTFTLKISGYSITQLLFPYWNSGDSSGTGRYYTIGTPVQDISQACWSSGEFYIVQPYSYTDEQGQLHELRTEAGEGTFTINADVSESVTASYISYDDSPEGATVSVTNQTYMGDDAASVSIALTLDLSWSCSTNYNDTVNGDHFVPTGQTRGKNYAPLGFDDIRIRVRQTCTAGSPANRQGAYNTLMKFDADAIELDSGTGYNKYKSADNVFYGYLQGGGNWESEEAMQAADEDDILWYSEKQGDMECVALLFESRSPQDTLEVIYNDNYALVHVKTDAEVDKVYITCCVTRFWSVTDIADIYNQKVEDGEIEGSPITASTLTNADGKQYVDQVVPSASDDYYTTHTTADLPAATKGYGTGDGSVFHVPGNGNTYVKTTYNADGTSTTHYKDNYGDSLYVMGYEANVEKRVAQEDEDGNTKESFRFSRVERVADYQLDTVMNMGSGVTLVDENGNPQTTTVTLTDTLPTGESYLENSAYFGLADKNGDFAIVYEQSDPRGQQGTVTGGSQVTVVSSESGLQDESIPAALYIQRNTDGSETLTFAIHDVPVVYGAAARIYYSVTLGDETNEENDLQNNQTVTNTVTSRSTEDIYRTLSEDYGNQTSATIAITKTGVTTFTKYAQNTYNEIDADLSWTVVLTAIGDESDVRLLDDMPVSGGIYGSSFTGSYTIADWSFDRGDLTDEEIAQFTLYYTTDEQYADESLVLQHQEGAITWEDITGEWSTVPITIDNDGAHADFSNVTDTVYAWALGGVLPHDGASINVNVTVRQDTPRGGDALVNTAWESTGTDTLHRSAPAYRVERSLSGTVWLDEDLDGGIDSGVYRSEQRISGVKVTLQRKNGSGDWDDVQETTTDENGEYEFSDLLPGTYRVVITDTAGNTYNLSDLSVTVYEASGVNASVNSKVKSEDSQYVIDGITMPEIDDMSSYTFDSDYWNAGFTQSQTLTVTKTWLDFLGNTITDEIGTGVDFDLALAVGDATIFTNSFTLGPSTWTTTVFDIPYYDGSGQELKITKDNLALTEGSAGIPAGFTMTYEVNDNTVSVTNQDEQHPIDITVYKVWDDADDQDGKRPESIGITLYQDSTEVETATLGPDLDPAPTSLWQMLTTPLIRYFADADENTWSYTFEGIYQYDDSGNPYTYTVVENDVPAGYTVSYEPESGVVGDDNTVTVTNTHTPETVDIEVTKEWDDAEDQDGIRPSAITLDLMGYTDETTKENVIGEKTLTLSETDPASDTWTGTFESLDKYYGGQEITYVVTEEAITVPEGHTGYTSEVGDLTQAGDDAYSVTVTNTHTPETIDIEVTKEWDDAEDQDGIRPDSVDVTLLQGTEKAIVETGQITAEGLWKTTFSNLPKYAAGEEISYTVTEGAIALPSGHDGEEGYQSEVGELTAVADKDNAYQITITNSHTPATTTVSGTKIWADNSNQDGIRPTDITVNLLGDTEKVKDQNVAAQSGDTWDYEFPDLPKYSGGTAISYTVTEEAVSEYTTAYDGYTITNSYTPATTTVTIAIDWQDDNNRDGVRPTEVTLTLTGTDGKTYEVTLNEGNQWIGTVDVPVYYGNGTKIAYSVTEETMSGYTAQITSSGDYNFTVTNSHTLEMTSVPVQKVWNDDGNRDGLESTGITVQLLANGTPMDGKTMTLSEGNSWTDTFTDLYKNEAGQAISYTVAETDTPDGYTVTQTQQDGTWVLTNNHDSLLVSEITIVKTWDDRDDWDGIRPESITVELQSGGSTVTDKDGATWTEELTADDADADGNWTITATDHPVYVNDSGTEITYTLHEDSVAEGYETEDAEVVITESTDDGGNPVYIGTATLTNYHEPQNTDIAYFPMDEEIVPGSDDESSPNSWLTEEEVQEYDQIEIEISTTLPGIPGWMLAEGDYTLTFHNELMTELKLDTIADDFHVYIGGQRLDESYYTLEAGDLSPLSTLSAVAADDCTFHVVLNLTALYNDGVITDDDLGVSTVRVFFYVDLEGAEVGHLYTSTAWYDLADAGEVLYTSDPCTVSVYIVADEEELEPEPVATGGTGDTGSGKSGGTGTTTTHKTKTDDPMHTALWIALACLGLAAMAGGFAIPATYRRRRRHRRQREFSD